MAAKGATISNDLLKLIFNATPITSIADNASSSPFTNLYVSLHTASPAGGNQTTSEAAYGSYGRIAVARTTGGWTVSTNSVSPVANISFAQATSGSETETHFAIGTASSGTGKLLYYGTISPNIVVSTSVQPILTTSTAITET